MTEAARNFADLINRAFYRGEAATLVRNGVPVARVVPPGAPGCLARELGAKWGALAHLGPEEAASFGRDLDEARRALPQVVPPWA